MFLKNNVMLYPDNVDSLTSNKGGSETIKKNYIARHEARILSPSFTIF